MKKCLQRDKLRYVISILFLILVTGTSHGQFLPAGIPILEEYLRRNQLVARSDIHNSFALRPLEMRYLPFNDDSLSDDESIKFELLPLVSITRYNSNRPYGWGDYGMIPNVGLQQYLSGGFYSQLKFLKFQFQPEIVIAQNRSYEGFNENFPERVIRARYHFWNYDDIPERYGDNSYSRFWWGQSSLTAHYGAFEIGAATRSIWWGPGQFNSLTFSNNAEGFPHLTFNTIKPAKTFIGSFEGQLLVGRLENSNIAPAQVGRLNENFFRPFTGDWRYLNAMTITYSPKWITGLSFGLSRTFQQFRAKRGNSFADFFPIFSAFQKERFFRDGNTVDFDEQARDQQVTVFTRYYNQKANAEIYFEFGRRDHSYNWREFILNPEHARAYLIGFNKLIPLSKEMRFVQVRGEVTHQQESINRYIRYLGLGGEASWHTHYQVRGFGNYGQPLGVGIGTAANVQTLEISMVEKFNKVGILLERLENHQDFFYRAFGQQSEHQPWIDLSLGFLADKQWKNLLFSSKLQLINSNNYQWQLSPTSTAEFPQGKRMFSALAQTSLIYTFRSSTSKQIFEK